MHTYHLPAYGPREQTLAKADMQITKVCKISGASQSRTPYGPTIHSIDCSSHGAFEKMHLADL